MCGLYISTDMYVYIKISREIFFDIHYVYINANNLIKTFQLSCFQLWPALSIQPRTFLTTLSRTCGLLSDLPATFMDRNWLSRASRLPILPVAEEANTTFSDR